jgi:hypothetical protein
METFTEVIAQLDSILIKLKEPLPKAEKANGWTVEMQTLLTDWLLEIRSELSNSRIPTVNLSRELDFAGIADGSLLESAAALSKRIRGLRHRDDEANHPN